jgi:hypothetical protein
MQAQVEALNNLSILYDIFGLAILELLLSILSKSIL